MATLHHRRRPLSSRKSQPHSAGNLPRGLFQVNGVYTVNFSDTGFKTVTMLFGTRHNVCTDID